MKIRSICPDSFASNCYLLIEGNEAFAVDPGVSPEAIQTALAAEGVTVPCKAMVDQDMEV